MKRSSRPAPRLLRPTRSPNACKQVTRCFTERASPVSIRRQRKLPAGNSSAVTSNAWPSRNSGCERDLRANTLAHAKEAFVTISALRAGDDQRSQPEKERPSFVRLAQLAGLALREPFRSGSVSMFAWSARDTIPSRNAISAGAVTPCYGRQLSAPCDRGWKVNRTPRCASAAGCRSPGDSKWRGGHRRALRERQ